MARAESAFFECPGGLHYPGALGPFGYYNFNWMHMHTHGSFAALPLIWSTPPAPAPLPAPQGVRPLAPGLQVLGVHAQHHVPHRWHTGDGRRERDPLRAHRRPRELVGVPPDEGAPATAGAFSGDCHPSARRKQRS